MSILKKSRQYKGQALVEFALVLPILLLIIVAVIEFSILMSSYLIVQSSARDAARQLAVGNQDALVFQSIRDNTVGIDTDALNFSATPAHGVRKRGDAIIVTVTYTHRVLTPLLSMVLGNSLNWSMQATMRYE